jgi:SAM-dependent methyltransferase
MSELEWPADGLERAADCPICGSAKRRLLYEGLSDRVFFVAPGTWSLWQCARCRTAWLDPWPNADTIHIAYQDYYTHKEPEVPAPKTAFHRLRAALGNAYRNRRFGTALKPALSVGSIIGALFPPLRWGADINYRFLPRIPSGRSQRVIDIGCSNGSWLAQARSAGWQVAGVEPDPVSRGQARDRGIEVRKSVADWLGEPETFDCVTINHVIEHVHDPLALLRDAYALLRPGGLLYVDTPNIDAWGHSIYGRDWLALDPPRHLILFNRDSLTSAVSQSGFRGIRFHRRTDAFRVTSGQSRQIRAGLDPFSDQTSPTMERAPGRFTALRVILARRHAEFLTMTAIKPRGQSLTDKSEAQ